MELPDYTLTGPDGSIRLVDVFDGRSQLIVYNHMWSDGAEWQCGGCTGLTSQYVRLGVTEWLRGWKARGWKTADRKPVKNEDLWRALDAAQTLHTDEWRWVRGHNGHPGNERADMLANRGVEVARGR